MFGRPKTPERNFDICSAKDLKPTKMYRRAGVRDVWTEEKPDSTIGYEEGIEMSLECPRTEAYVLKTDVFPATHYAIRSLSALATEAVCTNCPYARMNRAEVFNERAKTLRAHAEMIEAETAYNKALEEHVQSTRIATAELEEAKRRGNERIGELRAIEERLGEA